MEGIETSREEEIDEQLLKIVTPPIFAVVVWSTTLSRALAVRNLEFAYNPVSTNENPVPPLWNRAPTSWNTIQFRPTRTRCPHFLIGGILKIELKYIP